MYQYKCKIERIVDGDTIDCSIDLGFDVILKNQRVRLFNIDAPEVRTRDDQEKRFGLLASDFVKDFFEQGDAILVTREYNPTGKYGRIIGDFYINGKSLCESLVENHHAVIYDQTKDDREFDHLVNRSILIENSEK